MPGGLGIAPVTMPTHAVPPSHAGRSDKRRPLTVQSPSHRASNHGPVSPLSRAKRQAEGGVPYGSELAANRPNTTTAAGTGVARTSNEAPRQENGAWLNMRKLVPTRCEHGCCRGLVVTLVLTRAVPAQMVKTVRDEVERPRGIHDT